MKNRMIIAACVLSSVGAFAAAVVPSVTGVSISQDRSRKVTISYTLENGPAVVTFDIQTNCVTEAGTEWVSIGGRNVSHYTGDGNCLVTGDTAHSIEWHPDKSWPDRKIAAGGVRAVLTAWSPDSTPDYMVVDLAETSSNRVRYYTSTNDLPGGLLDNPAYRTTHLVMRRIHAKNVPWTKGSFFEGGRTAATEMTYAVTLTNDYYLGVFELTQGQWAMIKGTSVSAKFDHPDYCLMRPMENISYCMMRLAANNTENLDHWYPNPPHPESFLGVLRSRTNIDFDLPSEAQWEFAGRAGQCEGRYGNGAPYVYYNGGRPDPQYMPPGRYKYTTQNLNEMGTSDNAFAEQGPENGTALCGSYPPNAFGLYDMHGNVYDFCLDWYKADVTALGGAVNYEDGDVSGSSGEHYGKRLIVRKGGNWGQAVTSMLRVADRQAEPSTARVVYDGFRLMCTAGLK